MFIFKIVVALWLVSEICYWVDVFKSQEPLGLWRWGSDIFVTMNKASLLVFLYIFFHDMIKVLNNIIDVVNAGSN